MKTLAATLALTVMFLSAGAFAGNSHRAVPASLVHNDNLTVIEKNRAWPVIGEDFAGTCGDTRCFDI
ncbi:MAG: hypothetical protein HY245_04705 [Rhizobiales bacterium]|nr:hypothetical protein [Hyphomicrobiales bacterium]MBI3672714.1 hypothetical protein [Hyphomicrobiales bacterium]